MRNRWLGIWLVVCALALAAPGSSAGQEWSVNLGSVQVLQVLADGAGGVAVSYEAASAPGSVQVTWFDSLGRLAVSRALSGNGRIMDVSNRAIFLTEPVDATIFVVDRQGREATYPNSFANQAFVDRYTDVNGFFALRYDAASDTYAVVRISS